jgi:choline-sulfatase
MSRRPNILLIQCDQWSAQAVGAYGNEHVRTPAVDALAERGVRFEAAYTPCPLCRPARAAMWTSRWPHETGVLSNGKWFHDEPVGPEIPTLGELARSAGYQAIHAGKTHDHGTLRGFEVIEQATEEIPSPPGVPLNADTFHDVALVGQVRDALAGRDRSRPTLMVADVVNPHNICGWVGANAGPVEQLDVPEPLPPLPDNWDTPDIADRPAPVRHVCCSHRRGMQAARWSPRKYRQYLAAYYHYCRLADRTVGELLSALDNEGMTDDTVVLFLADHGDSMGAHRLVTKHTTFYEETTRVPLIAAGPGVSARGPATGQPLVSLLDVVPTVLALAGAEVAEGMRGRSLVPCFGGASWDEPRRYVVSEWHTEWGSTIEPGRMVRSGRFKYTRYVEGDGEELFDLEADGGETRNLAGDPAHAAVLDEHRAMLGEHCEQTGDPFFSLEIRADAPWRSHAAGYVHHEGTCAPMEWAQRDAE